MARAPVSTFTSHSSTYLLRLTYCDLLTYSLSEHLCEPLVDVSTADTPQPYRGASRSASPRTPSKSPGSRVQGPGSSPTVARRAPPRRARLRSPQGPGSRVPGPALPWRVALRLAAHAFEVVARADERSLSGLGARGEQRQELSEGVVLLEDAKQPLSK